MSALSVVKSWPDLFRPSTTSATKQDVDARDKRGHDGNSTAAVLFDPSKL
jgi:hypothetical protein